MLEDIFIRFLQLVWVPMVSEEVVWLIAPLLFGLIMINMYFGKYKTEQLGWNTAYANATSLMWVVVLLSKYLSENRYLLEIYPTYGYLIGGLGVLTLLFAYVNYQHSLPKRLAFFLSSALPTTALAYIVIVVVMGGIPIDWSTFWAGLAFYGLLAGMFRVYRLSITSPADVERRFEEKKKKQAREVKKIKRKIVKKITK